MAEAHEFHGIVGDAGKEGPTRSASGKDWRSKQKDSMEWEAVEHRPEGRPLVIPSRFFVPRQVVRHGFEAVDMHEAQHGVADDRLGWVKFSSVLAAINAFDEYFEESRDREYATELYHHATKEELPEGQTHLDAPDYSVQVRFDQHCILDTLRATLTPWERLFFMLEVPDSSSWASVGATVFIVTAILLSVLIFVLGSHPHFQTINDECKVQQANPTPCLEMTDCVAVCEPQAVWILSELEKICVAIFATEVTLRLVLAHKVRIQLRDWGWLQWFITGVSLEAEERGAGSSIWANSPRVQSAQPEDMEFVEKAQKHKQMGAIARTYTYFMKPTTLLDVFSVAPYFVELMISPTGIARTFPELIILRSLRLMRILRIFKLGKHGRTAQMLFRVLQSSVSSMFVLSLLVMMTLFISGTLVWLCEKGQWMPADHPFLVGMGIEGRDAFVRNVALLDDFPVWEESPFRSIPHCWWWAVVTITTVGYGDHFPTSRSGKVVGAVTAIVGVVILAMPIGVIGNNFAKELNKLVDEQKNRDRAAERERKKRLMRTFHKQQSDAKQHFRNSVAKLKKGSTLGFSGLKEIASASTSEPQVESGKDNALEPGTLHTPQAPNMASNAHPFGGGRPNGAVSKLLAVIEPTVGDCAPALWSESQQKEWLSAVRDFAGKSPSREEAEKRGNVATAEAVAQVSRGLGHWVTGSLLRLRPEALSGPELLRAVDRQVALLEAAAAAARELGSSVGVAGPPGWAQASAVIASTALLRCPSADTLSVSMASEGSTLSGDGWSASGGEDQEAVEGHRLNNDGSSSPEFCDDDELTPVPVPATEEFSEQHENARDHPGYIDPGWRNGSWDGPHAHYQPPMDYQYHHYHWPDSEGRYALPYEDAHGPPKEEDMYEQPETYGPSREYDPSLESYFPGPPVPHYSGPWNDARTQVGGYWHRPAQGPPPGHAHPDVPWHGPPGVFQDHEARDEYYD